MFAIKKCKHTILINTDQFTGVTVIVDPYLLLVHVYTDQMFYSQGYIFNNVQNLPYIPHLIYYSQQGVGLLDC